jgi:hypothetical protein
MLLPNLADTEYVDIFAGTRGVEQLARAVKLFTLHGVSRSKHASGASQLVAHCRYRKENVPHTIVLSLIERGEKRWAIGLDVAVSKLPDLSPGARNLVGKTSELRKTKKLERRAIENLLNDLTEEYRLSEMPCFVGLSGFADRSQAPFMTELLGVFESVRSMEVSCARFRMRSLGSDICLIRTREHALAGNDPTRERDRIWFEYTSALYQLKFSDIFPSPKDLTFLATLESESLQ